MKKTNKLLPLLSFCLIAVGALGQAANRFPILKPISKHSIVAMRSHRPNKIGTINILQPQYNATDSIQFVYVIPQTPISIPSSARSGWNFCINTIVKGSKLDTVGLWYSSQSSSCNSGGAITSAYTTIGVSDGRAPNVNSFLKGFYWFNDAANGGEGGSALTWPNTTNSNSSPYSEMGYCMNAGGYYFYDALYLGCTDTSYFPIQDIASYASVSYSSGATNGTAWIAYDEADQAISGQPIYYWFPPLYMNADYTLTDTSYNVLSSPNSNQFTINNSTVTFDTLWNSLTDNLITPINAGSVSVDTLWSEFCWRNTSCENDTLIFQVCAVNASGFPNTSVVYGADTLILMNTCASIPSVSNTGISVEQNYPNPFNKETTITYSLANASNVTFTVYDVTGRIIASNNYGIISPGQHEINLSADTFSPGIYFYTFDINGSIVTKKMVITE